jgi:hypothetical protein
MAGLGVHDKISKINAELARLELEMELDHATHSELGLKLSDLNPWKKGPLDSAVINADVKVFQEQIFLEVASNLKIAADFTALEGLQLTSSSAHLTGRLSEGDIHPSCIWRFERVAPGGPSGGPVTKVLFLFFWAGDVAQYSVYNSLDSTSKFDFSKMAVSQVWKSKAKNIEKDYSFVKGHLHADILVATGEWYPRKKNI